MNTTPFPVELDETARAWLADQHRQNPLEHRVLVLDLVASGCSGWSYRLRWQRGLDSPTDHLEHRWPDGWLLALPRSQLNRLQGTAIRYVRDGLQSRVTFDSPIIADTCGCGASVRFAA